MKYILTFVLAALPLHVYAQPINTSGSRDEGKRDKQLIEISEKIREFYIFEDVAERLAKQLKDEIKSKMFENLTDQEFADSLSTYLTKNGNDLHFNVLLRPEIDENPVSEKEMLKRFDLINRQWNYGFENVRRLDGNIGYIQYTGFPDANEAAKQTLAATMNFVANTNSLILDLRNNNGGSGEMVELFLSYFFREKTALGETYTRYNGKTTKSYTRTRVLGRKYLDKPIYILVNKKTISAAEALAYSLQKRGLATILGDVTYGAANPIKVFTIGKKFQVFVPISKAKSAFTNSNWEHIGVIPDVRVTTKRSLDTAHVLAMESLLKSKTRLELTNEEIQEKIRLLKQR